MLTTIRKLSESWFFKGILLVTALSFMSFFGIGGLDEIRGRFDSVIKVGDVKISGNELTRIFNAEVEKMRKKTGGTFTSKDAIQMGILQSIINAETSKAVVAMIAKDMDIAIPPEMIVADIYASPEFQDENGEFNRQRFEHLLSINRITEKDFVARIRDELTADQLFTTIGALAHTPKIMNKLMQQSSLEERDVKIVEILFDKMKVKQNPSKAELEAYYDSDKDKYMNPEYRDLSVAVLSYEDIFKTVPVSEAAVKARYEQNKKFYVKPERRKVNQMHFDSKEKAEEAVKKVKASKNFMAVAKSFASQSETDTNLGMVEKDGVLAELGEPIFAASKGDVIGPVESTMGWHVLEVTGIEPQQETPFSKVKDIIAAAIKKEIGMEKVYAEANIIDDFLGSGKTLEEAAKNFKLNIVKVPAVDITGQTKNGKKLAELYRSKDFLALAFSLPEATESQVTEFDKGFFIVRADKITAPEAKPLNEVKDKVLASWLKDRRKEVADTANAALLEAVKNGSSLTKAAKAQGLEVSFVKGLKKQGTSSLSARVSSKAFALPLNEVNSIALAGGHIVLEVDKISIGTSKDAAKLAKVVDSLSKEISAKNMVNDAISAFAAKYKVDVDYKQIKQIFEPSRAEEDME